MLKLVLRFKVVRGGEGNPNQSKWIPISKNPSMFNFYLVNVDNRDQNFVIFVRPERCLQPGYVPELSFEDMETIWEIICETTRRLVLHWGDQITPDGNSISIEYDVSQAPEAIQSGFLPGNIMDMDLHCSDDVQLLIDLVRDLAKRNFPLSICSAPRQYTSEECKFHFFPACQNSGTEACCMNRQYQP